MRSWDIRLKLESMWKDRIFDTCHINCYRMFLVAPLWEVGKRKELSPDNYWLFELDKEAFILIVPGREVNIPTSTKGRQTRRIRKHQLKG